MHKRVAVRVGVWVSFFIAGAFAGTASAAPSSSRLVELLTSDWGMSLLTETPVGQRLAKVLIGRPPRGVDRELIEQKLRFRWNAELESRLVGLNGELARVSEAEGAELLDSLAERYLGDLELLKNGRAPRTAGATSGNALPPVAGARAAFVSRSSSERLVLGTSLPLEAGSIEDRLPESIKVEPRLLELEERYLREQGLLQPGRLAARLQRKLGVQSLNLGDVMGEIIQGRKAMAEALRQLAAQYEAAEPFLARTIEKAAGEIDVSQSAAAKVRENLPDWNATIFDTREHSELLRGYTSKIRGEMGEIHAAIRTRGVVERGLNIRELGVFFGESAKGRAARSALARMAEAQPNIFQKELDLIFEGGFDWGEVKGFAERFSPQHQYFDRVMEQAGKTVKIKTLLESDPEIRGALEEMGTRIRLRLYFTHGVTPEAAQRLERLGIEVHGVRAN
jgi:hypothetical protein